MTKSLKVVWNFERFEDQTIKRELFMPNFYWKLLWLFWKIKTFKIFQRLIKRKEKIFIDRRYSCLRSYRDRNKAYIFLFPRGTSWNRSRYKINVYFVRYIPRIYQSDFSRNKDATISEKGSKIWKSFTNHTHSVLLT